MSGVPTIAVVRSDGGPWVVLAPSGVDEFAHGNHNADEVLTAVERHYLDGAAVSWSRTGDDECWAATLPSETKD